MAEISFDDHFKDLFENTSDLIHFLTLKGDIVIVNPAWLKTLQYNAAEVIGKSIYDFIHESCIKEYKQARAEAIKNNKGIDIITTLVSKSGQLVIGDGQIGCLFNKSESGYTRCVFKNITARKLAEKKIEESEKRLKTFIKCGPDAIIVINQDQIISEWNPKAELIFGYTIEEVVGKRLTDIIIPHQYREAHESGMTHFLKTGEGVVFNKTLELTALHKKGNEFYINLSVSNVKVESEWFFIAFISDISGRKKTEQSLIHKEAELLQAKLLEEKKDEFISIASHELKTPLTTIKAYAQLALSLSKGEEHKTIEQFLRKIDQYAGKLNSLLNELLDVSKIHAGKLRLTPAKVEFDALLPEILNSMQHITQNHEIILEKNDPAIVNIDALRLEQVITNLITNAAKYSPGKEKIIVRSELQEGVVVISFTDFGVGIPTEKINKIFDRFYRVDEVAKDFSGFGIGLFVSSEIIKQHDGKIWAESKEKEGSTFYFSLPVSQKN